MTPKDLRARRLELGLSIADVAERLNTPPDVVSAWERGDTPLDTIALDALTKAPSAIRRLLLLEPQGTA
jgi:DNA-binding transcriptional regulator YiaG